MPKVVLLKKRCVFMAQSKVWSKVKYFAKRWFIDAFSGMALGLFATLIAGTIFAQIAVLVNSGGQNVFGNLLGQIATIAKFMMGAGIGAGIAYMLKTDKLTLFSCIVAGMVGANASGWLPDFSVAVSIGNPIGAYLTSLAVVEICSLYAGKTRLDIILIPIGAMFVTCIVAVTLCPPVTWAIEKLGQGIALATDATPFLMGIIIAVAMGVLLTLPTSSAAIWVALAQGISDDAMLLAGGAAVVGCACHMVGFAVMSFKENGWSGLIAQGVGTSMLQIPNIMKKPIIMLPEIVASAISGLVAVLLNIRCTAAGGGMGTSGLVGLFGVIDACALYNVPTFNCVLGIVLCLFVIPAVVAFGTSEFMRKKGWIKDGDMKLEN